MQTVGKVLLIGMIFFLLLVVAGGIYLKTSGAKKEDYLHLTSPRIVEKNNVKALTVYFDGDPNTVIKEAFSSLYAVYYKLKDVPKFNGQKAPIARYEQFDNLLELVAQGKLKEVDWKGFVAIPLPDKITAIPEKDNRNEYPVNLETLTYGTVAEIVHFGAYEEEAPTINRLKEFIEAENYEIVGLHEEEYIKGPGMPFSSPKNYITIIRYQVRKK